MAVTFNADEIFEMGIQIENNGKAFYESGAAKVDDAKAKEVLLDLAGKEERHAEIFRTLRAGLPDAAGEPTVFDPEGMAGAYLRAAADTHVFNVHKSVDEVLEGVRTAREVVKLALGFEKDSIVFFLSMKDVVPPTFGRDQIDKLIREEQSHIRDLAAILSELAMHSVVCRTNGRGRSNLSLDFFEHVLIHSGCHFCDVPTPSLPILPDLPLRPRLRPVEISLPLGLP